MVHKFLKIDDKVFVAGSYFGSGIYAGTLFGEQIALMATDQQSDEIRIIEERKNQISCRLNLF